MFGRFTRDDKMLLAFATQEAADLGHHRLGNDHLILGMLCNARTPLFGVLHEAGLNLVGARDSSRAYHEENDTDDDAAAQESAADRYEQDREALRSIGIDLDKVRAAVRDRFGDDLADGWAERPERGRGRGRGRGECGPHGRGPHGHGRGRGRGRGGWGPEGWGPEGWGPEGRGPEGWDGPGFGPGFGPGGRGFGPGGPGFGPGGFGPGGPFEPGRGRRGPRGRGMRPRFAPETREALEAAVRIARERDDRQLRAEYLLLGIIEVADPASLAVISAVTTPDDLKAAILASLPEAPAGV
ncbi:Clp protease N-terminal domain-containing protein [Gordonia sp. DT30]|uniref:Clp protease N-terminal domain-containing protein n=1 Tax=Gordonia sp. DT30 TaxID=3416546 RepID=UPI003CFA09FE